MNHNRQTRFFVNVGSLSAWNPESPSSFITKLTHPPTHRPTHPPTHHPTTFGLFFVLEQTDSSTSPSAEVVFDDTFFVTGGGRSDPTEISSGKGAGNHINAKHAIATTTATTGPASSDGRRPRSTPMALPSNQRKLAPLGDPEHTPEGSAVGGLALTRMRRDVWTADGDCLGYRRLRFRSQPIHDLVSATLKSIDPSGVFSMYQEWSNVKNRLLSRELFLLGLFV